MTISQVPITPCQPPAPQSFPALWVWMTLSRKNVLKVKNLKSIFSKDKFSLFSREGLRNILDEYVDLKKVSQSNKALYVATTNNDKNRGELFMLNNKSEYEIKQILYASTAIPGAFESVMINGDHHSDGYLFNNVPINILINNGCDLILSVPLSENGAPYAGKYHDVTVIDFKDPNYKNINVWEGTFGFEKEISDLRIKEGFENADRLLTYLREEGILSITKSEKRREFFSTFLRKKKYCKKFYSLKDVGIIERENN